MKELFTNIVKSKWIFSKAKSFSSGGRRPLHPESAGSCENSGIVKFDNRGAYLKERKIIQMKF